MAISMGRWHEKPSFSSGQGKTMHTHYYCYLRLLFSLLARLHAPTASELARKCKCASNPPSGKQRAVAVTLLESQKALSLSNAYVNILQSRSLFRIIPCSVEAVGKNCLSRRVALRTTVVLLNILKERGGSRSSNHAIKI